MSYVDKFVESIKKHECKTVIYGAGLLGKNYRFFLQEECGIFIDSFCDQNPDLWGTVIENNTLCISPEELVRQKESNVVIAVALKHLEEVKFFLERNQIKNYITWLEISRNNWLKNKFCMVDCIGNRAYKNIENIFLCDNRHTIRKPKKIAVYTFITDGYDELQQPLVIDEDADYYVISDNKINDLGIYKYIDVASVVPDAIKDSLMRNRYCKMHGAEIFKEYDYSIYLDGGIQISGDITDYLKQTGRTGIALYLNEDCRCIYETGIVITLIGRCNFEMARKQLRQYAMEGMPENYGLLCGTYIFRDNKNSLGNELMELWWKEYLKWPTRDQLCLTYVMWKMGLKLEDIGIINKGKSRWEDKNIIHHSHCYVRMFDPRNKNEVKQYAKESND